MKSVLLVLLSTCLPVYLFSQSVIDDHFRIDQLGYRPSARKVAVIIEPQTGFNAPSPYTPGPTLEIRDASTQSVVFSGSPVAWTNGNTHTQSGDKGWWFEFTALNSPGDYYVNDPTNNRRSYTFTINDNVYNDALKHAVRALYYQRCGMPKSTPYASSQHTDNTSCHVGTMQDLNCRDVTQPSNTGLERDLSGGWHDAGDYNKYTNFCHATVHYLLDAYEQNPGIFPDNWGIPESGNGVPDILDEIKWELDWLLKMQESNGGGLMKVSIQGFSNASPPSLDTPQRYYGYVASSATRTLASIFAHAAIVYNTVPSTQTYAATLLTRAQLAWTWLQNNPGFSNYPNTGFSSANPEISQYAQSATSFTAAVYLYAATGNTSYRTYVDANYTNIQPMQWTYWYPFESAYQDALLYYTTTPGATASVVNAIRNNCSTSVSVNNADLLPAVSAQTDLYRAYMKNADYVWNNNEFKAETGSIFWNMIEYNVNNPNQATYRYAAEDYVHFFHGVNAVNYSFLSKSDNYGADRPIREIYHGWFGDGTIYDGSAMPYIGPPPGYLTCGINPTYQPDGSYTGPPISPPMNQPVQKSYKDWNTSWPENSWEVTEVGIYTQAAYIKLLSKFADTASVVTSSLENSHLSGFRMYPNPSTGLVYLETDFTGFEVSVLTAQGKMVKQFSGNKVLDLSGLAKGIYLIRVRANDHTFVQRLSLHY